MKQRTPIILVCVIPPFVRSLHLVIKKGLRAHAEGGWPNEGRERVSTHVILVNEFRQSFFYIFFLLMNISVVIAASYSCESLFSLLPLLISESLI